MLLIAAAIAAVPLLMLGALVISGGLDPGTAGVAAVSVVAAAMVAAVLRAREHHGLVAWVRRAA